MILAGQKPSWIASFRNAAGLKGDKVMPKTSEAMKALLEKKNKPILDLWKNKKYNQLQNPMTFTYPVVKKTAPKLSVCSEWEGDSNLSRGPGESWDNGIIDKNANDY